MYISKQQFKPNFLTLLVIIAFSLFSFRNEDTSVRDIIAYLTGATELDQDAAVGKDMSFTDFQAATAKFQREGPEDVNIRAINIPKDFITAVFERYGTEMSKVSGFRLHYGISEGGKDLGIITKIDQSFQEESSSSDPHYAIPMESQMMGPCPHRCD